MSGSECAAWGIAFVCFLAAVFSWYLMLGEDRPSKVELAAFYRAQQDEQTERMDRRLLESAGWSGENVRAYWDCVDEIKDQFPWGETIAICHGRAQSAPTIFCYLDEVPE